MSEPGFAIQSALVARISALATEVGDRVYDDVPAEEERVTDTGAAWPYISLGDGQVVPIDEECSDRISTYIDINVWSRAVGFPEVKRIAWAVRSALHEQGLSIEGHILDQMRVESINYLRDPDGSTRRARIALAVDTQPAN